MAIYSEVSGLLGESGIIHSSDRLNKADDDPAVEAAALVLDAPAAPGSIVVAAPLPVFSHDQIAGFLQSGYWGGPNYRWNMGNAGTALQFGVLTYNIEGLTAGRQALANEALALYETILGINFVRVFGAADMTFDDEDSGAYASFSASGDIITSAFINVDVNWFGGSNVIGDYTFQTFLHEIGHALGLGHGGAYNGSANYVTDTTDPDFGNNSNHYLNDSWQATMMSYFDQLENTHVNADYAFLISPMIADWIALGNKYGTSAFAFSGNTTWGFNTNIGTTVFANLAGFADDNAFTIFDAGGIDTVDFSGYGANQVINLASESISNVGGLVGNMSIARGTVIENAVGGSGNDTIYGNGVNNALYGNAGGDYLYGFGGSDYLSGGDGNDVLLTGGGGHDQAWGGNGDDVVYWGPPSPSTTDDRYHNGGAGLDWIYGGGTVFGGVTFNLAAGTYNNGGSFTEEWVAFEHYYNWGTGHETVIGTDVNNTLITGSGNNTLWGHGGADSLTGGAGNDLLLGGFVTDTVDGGDGNDTLRVLNGEFYDNSYGGLGTDVLDHSASSYSGSTFDFELGKITGAGINGASAVLSGIEVYHDGSGNNTIISDGNANSYYGNGGNDLMIAEVGGEYMYGGAGIDTIDLSRWNGPYTVDMITGSSNYGAETYQQYENLIAGGGNDHLSGTNGANKIQSGGGNDTVIGRGGKDVITGGLGKDVIFGGADHDTFDYNVFAESKKGAANCDVIEGFSGAGAGKGDLFDFLGLGDLKWGKVQKGIYLENVGAETHCYIKGKDFEIAIDDGGTTASDYTAADFLFL